ncbi:MAG: LysM peptidoglycan-binding domain-containing protein [Bacilli bacterium]|nr:LysM peptidoglycan-binding domain-containing protein [Bacilli bacterium]
MYTIYNVMYGDTLDEIATYYNTDVSTLREINNFPNNYQVSMGDQIIVPAVRNNRFITYIVKKGDNLYEIARQYNVDVNTLMMLNGLNKDDFIYPNQEIIVPRDNTSVYITKDGDTLNTVLNNSGLSLDELYSRNREIYLLPDQLLILKD